MTLLKNKSWIAQEFYNEYLKLKVEIAKLSMRKERTNYENAKEIEKTLEEKVSRMKFVLYQLKFNGISLEDLILLGLGVDV